MHLTSSMGAMWIWWVLVGLGVIAAAWFVVLANRESVTTDESQWWSTRRGEPDDAEQLLRWRFADGELTEEEFSKQLAILRQATPSQSTNEARE